jgi:hypothetical protein
MLDFGDLYEPLLFASAIPGAVTEKIIILATRIKANFLNMVFPSVMYM